MTGTATTSLLQPQSQFRGSTLPEPGVLAGYAALSLAFDVEAGLPPVLAVIGKRHKKYESGGWRYYTPRHRPPPTLSGHLTFALRYEGLALEFLTALFGSIDPQAIESIVKTAPTGRYARRIWLLFEWLTGQRLNLPNAAQGVYADTVDPDLQLALPGRTTRRYRLRENLPGTRDICPMAQRHRTGQPSTDLAIDAFRERLSLADVSVRQNAAATILSSEQSAAQKLSGSALVSHSGEAEHLDDVLARLFAGHTPTEREPFESFARKIIAGCRPAVAAALAGFAFAARHADFDQGGTGHLRLLRLIAGSDPETGFPLPILTAIADHMTEYRQLVVAARMHARRGSLTAFDATEHVALIERAYLTAINDAAKGVQESFEAGQAAISGGVQP